MHFAVGRAARAAAADISRRWMDHGQRKTGCHSGIHGVAAWRMISAPTLRPPGGY
jgi:hypothetical protein